MSKYYDDVKRYDSGASEEMVTKIEKHLGIALQGKDSSLVSCSDTSELDRVREKWCMKKLGATDKSKADEVIATVCAEMKGDSRKQRVTFYYLVAKHMDAMGKL